MESYRPSLLVLTDGQPFDPALLVRLAEDFRASVYFHAPAETDEKDYGALRRDLALLCDKLALPFIEDTVRGSAWDDHVRADHVTDDPTASETDPAFARIDHFVSYAQTEGFDFCTTIMPSFVSAQEERHSHELFREAADVHGIRYYEGAGEEDA